MTMKILIVSEESYEHLSLPSSQKADLRFGNKYRQQLKNAIK
jgi:hypothetical protein